LRNPPPLLPRYSPAAPRPPCPGRSRDRRAICRTVMNPVAWRRASWHNRGIPNAGLVSGARRSGSRRADESVGRRGRRS
jgi:hypothetical protein